jgi:lysozyme
MRNSLFAPEKIIGSQKGSKESALNFISGGSPLASSVFSGAKNNIVGFNRAKISPKRNNLGSLISTLTTNIFNNTNSVSNIFGDKKEKSEKGFKPFGGFFDKVKEAIGFISFFGSKKNLDKIKENIDNLKTTFTETFDVAKALRKAILKIIEQLSGFSGGGGGGPLDAIMAALGGLVGGLIPGKGGKRPPNVAGPAMKQEGNLLSKIPKGLKGGGGGIGKLLLGGAAAVGTGAAISGLSQPGDEDVQPGDTAPEVPGNVLDKFNSILDRFDKVLDGLMGGKGKKGSESGTGSKSSGSSGGGGGSPTPTPPPGGMGQGAQGPAGEATRSLLDTIAYAEGTSKYDNQGYNTHFGGSQTSDLSKHPDKVISSGGYSSAAFGRYQFMPGTWNSVGGGSMDPERQDAGAVRLSIKRLNQAGIKVKDENELEALLQKEGLSSRISAALSPEWASFPTATGNSYYGQPVKKLQNIQKVYAERLKTQSQGITKPAPIKPGQQAPQTLTKPGQQAPQVSLVNVGSGTPQAAQSRPSSTTTPATPTGGNGPTAPFLPSYNPDNFLTLYSRMVYNIVG